MKSCRIYSFLSCFHYERHFICGSFLFIAERYCIVQIHYYSFVCGGPCGLFLISAVMNETATKIHVVRVCGHVFSFLWGKCSICHCSNDSMGISICQNSSGTNLKLPRLPLCGWLAKQTMAIYNMQYYSEIKKNKLPILIITWRSFTGNHAEWNRLVPPKVIYCMIPFEYHVCMSSSGYQSCVTGKWRYFSGSFSEKFTSHSHFLKKKKRDYLVDVFQWKKILRKPKRKLFKKQDVTTE